MMPKDARAEEVLGQWLAGMVEALEKVHTEQVASNFRQAVRAVVLRFFMELRDNPDGPLARLVREP